MKAFVVLAVLVGAAFSAPTEETGEIQRIKKSYGAAPCGGPVAPVAVYLGQGGLPHYREDELLHEERDDHVLKARSYYGAPGISAASAASAASSASVAAAIAAANAAAAAPAGPAAPAVGIFPGARLGGCAVPLLLSCAPSVHSGHIAHAAAPAYPLPAAAIPAYRTENEHVPKMREMMPVKQWSETDHVAKMREMEPQQPFADLERALEMRESGVPRNGLRPESENVSHKNENIALKKWAESERATQMRENAPLKNWTESARGVDMKQMPMEAHHHHHHFAGDLDSIHHA